jgi:polysaccharide deacetylase family protein (PEP-CTERM system associated)
MRLMNFDPALARGPEIKQPIPDVLSIDVEDYFQVEAFADFIRPDTWDQYPSRVVDNTRRVLDLLGRAGVHGTFFILGWVAERFPQLVREILAGGHEVACHSYLHQCIWRLTPEEFRRDTRRAKAAIEDAGGEKLLGYRAPTFSVVKRTLWAVRILAEEGFVYDSSVFPIRHDTYGMPDAPRSSFLWDCGSGVRLREFPMSTVEIFKWNLPVGGGGYLRLMPPWYTRWAMAAVKREGNSLQLYFHPWEIDPEQPHLKAGWKSRLRHYRNLHCMQRRIEEVLAVGQFAPLRDRLDDNAINDIIAVELAL